MHVSDDPLLDQAAPAQLGAGLHRGFGRSYVPADHDQVLSRADGARQQQFDRSGFQHRVLGQHAGRNRRGFDKSNRIERHYASLSIVTAQSTARTTPSMLE